jgi:UDP-N-acetylmuramyl-tripeptide synthetase
MPPEPHEQSIALSSLFVRAGVESADGKPVPSVPITFLTEDSRTVRPGACFVAVRGVGRDGHDYVEAAVRAGASAVLIDRNVSFDSDVCLIRVREARMALAQLAAAYYSLAGTERALGLVGVTGTNGKTTVTWLLRSILRAAGLRPALVGTVEYDLIGERRSADMTTPAPLELCRYLASARGHGATHAVLEVSSHALDQHRCDGLRFGVGVFTNLTGDHLDYHASREAYCAAKRRLFGLLPDDGVAVTNADDPLGAFMASAARGRVLRYAIDANDAQLRADIQRMDRRGSRFTIHSAAWSLDLRFALPGRYNVLNALAAAGAAEALGVSMEAIATGLETFVGVPGRLERVEPPGHPFTVLVDYAHTDDALRNVLRTLRPLTSGRLICIFGCGGDRDRTKRPRMAQAVEATADQAFVTSDNPRSEDPRAIIEEILVGFSPKFRAVAVEVDRRRAIESAVGQARPGDTILIAGKGHETYQLIGDRVLRFSDVEVARECLSACGKREAAA